jgi:hypothetical protein
MLKIQSDRVIVDGHEPTKEQCVTMSKYYDINRILSYIVRGGTIERRINGSIYVKAVYAL